jgi:AraC-like DNA-binding protein
VSAARRKTIFWLCPIIIYCLQPSEYGDIMPIPVQYHETIITPVQSRNIEAIWSYVAEKEGKSTILPDGRCDIIMRFNVHDGATAIPIITGPATQPYDVSFSYGDACVGIRLRPGRGAVIWSNKIAAARNQVLRGTPVFERLPALAALINVAPTVLDVSAALAEISIFTALTTRDTKITQAIERVHFSGGRLRVEALAASMSCSSRQLNRMFCASVGLPAKVYSSLVQFHRTLGLIRNEKLGLADAAFEAGYADQAHMARSVRRFSGFPPSDLPRELTTPGLFG